jgi:hypothetical protein
MAEANSLEERVAALEQEVARLKAGLHPGAPARQSGQPAPDEEPLGDQLLREARGGQAELAAGWTTFMEELGIQGQPIGARKLREMLIADGIDPNDNSFSREIIAMREE